MATQVDIKAAVELLDVKDDAQWNKDGTPKLEAVRDNLKDQTVKKEDVLAAIGDYRRPGAEPGPGTGGADKEDEVTAATPVDPTQELVARLDAARERRDSLGREMDVEHEKIRVANHRIAQLTVLQDKEITFIEANEKQVSHAEIVKRIQKQTQERLAQTVQATQGLNEVLKQSGLGAYPSKLDQTMALRRRTPEQQANYAKFVHQNAANVSAARG